MRYLTKSLTILSAAAALCACSDSKKSFEMGTYGYDVDFMKNNGIETVELAQEGSDAKIMVIPAWQGRVMTCTAAGENGASYGWINYKLIESGVLSDQFNAFGGEERFWLGPEGGPFSLYFKKGEEQVYSNWNVPKVLDTEAFKVIEQSDSKVSLTAQAQLVNASDVKFNIRLERTVSMLSRAEAGKVLGQKLPANVKVVAYESLNTITNQGQAAWDKTTGMPSIWLLGMFNPTKTTTVFIPYNQDGEGVIVNDEYFGKVPADRLVVDNGVAYFKIDGECRTKIGLPAGRATELCGSFDSANNVLTILKYTLPEEQKPYVNSQWGEQDDPFCGDVINSYNDGPTDDGTVMGPFYEIETSSPAADLAAGQSLSHSQCVMHIEGERADLQQIAKALFGVDLERVATVFAK